MADDAAPRFFFDYVDPGCYVMERRLREIEADTGRTVIRHPFEIVPPPDPMVDASSDLWIERREAARRAGGEELGEHMGRPSLVPWTRKAHELALHAREAGCFREVHEALFHAYHVEERDVGRVDVLVELAGSAGLDRSETKAVLDVDRHLERVLDLRKMAERLEVVGVPTVLVGGERVEGFSAPERVETLLAG